MLLQNTILCRIGKKIGGLACAFISLLTLALAQPAGTGVVRGRVLNELTGNYLTTARVAIQGTDIETYTNNDGVYVLANVPAGEATVIVSYVGLERQTAAVQVTAGQSVAHDFTLRVAEAVDKLETSKTLKLEPMSVRAKDLSGQAVAENEQRVAVNLKNVISLDQFVDQAEGNIGEFLKFVPGLDFQYNPFNPQFATIRGMRASGTIVLFDGVPAASAIVGNSRSFDMNTAGSGNVDRLEVSKVPTPDVPANAIGGTINVISKSGFSRKTPLFSYNIFSTYNALEGEFDPSFGKVAGPNSSSSKRPVQLGYDLAYILPLNQKLGFTFALTRAPRYNQTEFRTPTWNVNTGVLSSYQLNEYVSNVDIQTAKASMDWKINQDNTVQLSFYDMDRRSLVRQHFSILTPGAGSTGDSTHVQGAATSVGTSGQTLNGNMQYRTLRVMSARYNYNGPIWQGAAFLSYSKGGAQVKDMDDGFFGTVVSNQTSLRLRLDNLDEIDQRGIPLVTATRAGAAVDTFDATNNSINTTTSAASQIKSEMTAYGAHASRVFNFTIPTQVKIGVYQEVLSRDNTGGTKTYTFTPPGGAAGRIASNFDVFNDAFSKRAPLTDVSGRAVYSRYLSWDKVFDLYRSNPSWFVLNDATAHMTSVNASTYLEETISAAYFLVNNKFLGNKLNVASGVRYERTEDDGSGPLNDIAATYQRDASGNFIRNGSGQLVKITTNALANNLLQYKERGYHQTSVYDGFYPSVNARYSFTDNLVLRAGYARTIFRPELGDVIASVSVSDPGAADTSTRIVTLVDGKLKPWEADAFDLTFEAYDIKGATFSVAVFQKNISDFFAVTESPITTAELEEFGLPSSFTDYDVRRTRNGGNAKLSGVEVSYRQTWNIIPVIGRNIQTFANVTSLDLQGEQAKSFEEFSPRNFNAGISYVARNISIKLNMQNNKWVRRTAAADGGNNGTGGYTVRAPSTKWDFSAEYRLSKWFSAYYSVRNLTAEPVRLQYRSPDQTLDYTRPRNYQFVPAAHTLGIKGRF